MDKHKKVFDITDFNIIQTIVHMGNMPTLEMAKEVGIAHKNLWKRLNKLEDRGLIERIRKEKYIFVRLTKKDKELEKLLDEFIDLNVKIEARLLGKLGLEPEDMYISEEEFKKIKEKAKRRKNIAT